MKRSLEDINDYTILKKKSKNTYILRDDTILLEDIYLYDSNTVYTINSPVLFSYYIYKEKYFEYNNDNIFHCKSNSIYINEFEKPDLLIYSDLLFQNYNQKTLLYTIPYQDYKSIIRYTYKYKSPYIRLCTYYSIRLQFENENPSKVITYLNLNTTCLGEFYYSLKLFNNLNLF